VLVKTSYFPNWQAIGADGPWRVTPNLMVVVPTSTHVELHYGYTPVDNAGRLATVAGLAAVGALWWRERDLEPALGGQPGDDRTGDGQTGEGQPDDDPVGDDPIGDGPVADFGPDERESAPDQARDPGAR
jgi:hypothetical protein